VAGVGTSRWIKAMIISLACVVSAGATAVAAEGAEPPSYLSSFGPDGTESTGFGGAGPIAVDQAADLVYVIDHPTGSLLKFDLSGHPVAFTGTAGNIAGNAITGLSFFSFGSGSQVAVDSTTHRIYVTSGNSVVAFEASGEPAEFTAGPGSGTNAIGGFTELLGVAVDLDGNIYTSDYGFGVRIYSPTGEFVTQFETSGPANVAVDSAGAVYVNRWEGNVLKFTPSGPVTPATTYLAATEPFDPTNSLTVTVDPLTNDVYIAESEVVQSVGLRARIAWYDENGNLLATFAGEGEAGAIESSEGVGVDDGGKVFVADWPNSGLSQVEIFGEEVFNPEAPSVISLGVTDVTATSATLQARLNPNTLPTTYHFEYGLVDCAPDPSLCTAVPAAGASIGSGHEPVGVSAAVTDLEPNTTYHFRIVAENSLDTTESEDRTFTTQALGAGFSLADARVWEMVSPPQKFGGVLRSSSGGTLQAAQNGNGLVYQSLGSIERDPDGNRANEPASVLARRTSSGWQSRDITPPHSRATTVAAGTEYDVFSLDLSRGLLEPRDGTPLSPAASERTPYLRENSDPPVYTPLVTSKEGFANVSSGTEFGGDEASGQVSDVTISGANSDLDHVVLASKTPLVADAEPESLYEWHDGQLEAVSVLPASEGGGIVQGVLGSEQGSVRNAVSEDGSRVFWSPGFIGTGQIHLEGIYVYDAAAGASTRLDLKRSDASGFGDPFPAFQGASLDGTVVYFTDPQQLTADASPSGRDLYRCEIPAGASGSGCTTLTDISTPLAGSGESADVQGLVSAFSNDGSRVYFVATGVLDDAENQAGKSAVSGEPNLYLWEEGTGVRFIATLSSEDDRDWGKVNGTTPGYARALTATASPSGRYLSFMSQLSLTGYDNRDPGSGELTEQVYVYDAVADAFTCASCNPTDASPTGQGDPTFGADVQGLWRDRWVAATVPESTISMGGQLVRYPSYRPRSVLDNGRVFFNAIDDLVAADSNNDWDVYQYEPTGVGSCSSSSSGNAVARTENACVSLISSGTTGGPSVFLDASASGDDVFFLTPGRLSVLDKDSVNDVYDARVNGTAAVRAPASGCVGETCQPSLGLPVAPTPASEAFRGPEGAIKCPKGKREVRRHGKVRCVRKHHRHKKHHHKRAGQNQGAHR
jgi:hypothetical protein